MSQKEALYKCRLLRGAFRRDEQDGPLYKCRLLLAEDPAFGAKPRPECSANFFPGPTHSFNLSFSFPRFVAWALQLGLGTHNPRFGVAPQIGVRDSHSTLCYVAP